MTGTLHPFWLELERDPADAERVRWRLYQDVAWLASMTGDATFSAGATVRVESRLVAE